MRYLYIINNNALSLLLFQTYTCTKKMSGSVCKGSRNLRDDSLPLILQLLEEEPATAPVHQEGSHSQGVTIGVAVLLGRWPGHVTSICLSAAAITVLTTIMIATPIVTITMLGNSRRSELERGTASEILGTETHCLYQKEQDTMMSKAVKSSDYDTFTLIGLQSISSFDEVRKNINVPDELTPAQRRIFFVITTDSLSKRHLCAVESAAKTASNYYIYIIMLSINNTKANIKSYKPFEKLSNVYPNIKIFNFAVDIYFRDSPMRDIWQRSNIPLTLLEFAARILTLWRYGGITYDLDLITLDNTSRRPYPFPSGDDVMISTDGGNVMSAKSHCHAFLYDMMMSVSSLYAKHQLSNNDVIQHTLKNVCYNIRTTLKPDTLLQEEAYNNCTGVSDMPRHTICKRAQRTAGDTDCVWALYKGEKVHVQKHLCPLSYRQYAMKEASQLKRTWTHKFRHKQFY
jgi:Glycosyltransferase sugar-binding region containing DXD motif.